MMEKIHDTCAHKNPLLRIDEVFAPHGHGIIGMTFCPGKKQKGGLSGDHCRDLRLDLEAIRAWGAEILISLIQTHEYAMVDVEELPTMVPKEILHLRLPIQDVSTPDAAWEKSWEIVSPLIRSTLRRGGRVCIHCMGGLGRTGLVSARILVEMGMSPEKAIEAVRTARPGTIETREQENYVKSMKFHWQKIDRARACLLAGACGDALGATVEFMDREEILAQFGNEGILDMVANSYGEAGKITDDTQMSLFTADALIRSKLRHTYHNDLSLESCFGAAYLRWLQTQERSYSNSPVAMNGWLFTNRELFSRRGPGTTCLSALLALKGSSPYSFADNNSKGCGGIMRAAPIGIFAFAMNTSMDEKRTFAFAAGCASARVTHGHPSGYLSAGALALIILELLSGSSLCDAVGRAQQFLRNEQGQQETLSAIEKAQTLAQGTKPPQTCIPSLGKGWVGEEALAIALFCAFRAKSLQEGLVMAVNITGDSDSTGSITGNILGAMYGSAAIPPRWIQPLELRDVITTMTDDLFAVHDILSESAQYLTAECAKKDREYWTERYPIEQAKIPRY